MRKMLDELWNNYFAEECAVITTDEERALLKRTGTLREALNKLITTEQRELLDRYVEALYEIEGIFNKKIFFSGCKFAATFFFELDFYKNNEHKL